MSRSLFFFLLIFPCLALAAVSGYLPVLQLLLAVEHSPAGGMNGGGVFFGVGRVLAYSWPNLVLLPLGALGAVLAHRLKVEGGWRGGRAWLLLLPPLAALGLVGLRWWLGTGVWSISQLYPFWLLRWTALVGGALLLDGLRPLGRETYAAARLDGASGWGCFVYLEAPALLRQMRRWAAVFVFLCVGPFLVPLLCVSYFGMPTGSGPLSGGPNVALQFAAFGVVPLAVTLAAWLAAYVLARRPQGGLARLTWAVLLPLPLLAGDLNALPLLPLGPFPLWMFEPVAVGLLLCVLVLKWKIREIPPERFEAMEAEGAGERTQFFRAVVPETWGTAAALLVFLFLSLWASLLLFFATTAG